MLTKIQQTDQTGLRAYLSLVHFENVNNSDNAWLVANGGDVSGFLLRGCGRLTPCQTASHGLTKQRQTLRDGLQTTNISTYHL